jgi:AraC family transcriptional regulator
MGFSRRVEWRGGRATAYLIRSASGEAVTQPGFLQAIFCFTSRRMEAECSSPGSPRTVLSKSRHALVLPRETTVEWKVRTALQLETLELQLNQDFVLRCSGLACLPPLDRAQMWDYSDPLGWQVARAIYDDCVEGAVRSVCYVEMAAMFLAAHLVRTLAVRVRPPQAPGRSGFPAGPLRRACQYMMGRLDDGDLSLREVAAVAGLSVSHFVTAFRRSIGVAPFVWLRRQRIERAKELLRDPGLDMTAVALALGYANQSAFGVAFKRETGTTASRWRRQDHSHPPPNARKTSI